ncbi:M14 family zinc carboxypeptidase [Croceiramulus getboli]|nr:M14 family zinc carboxypeptidase [Flavobacteriaceae bacterium YJPT1-3]
MNNRLLLACCLLLTSLLFAQQPQVYKRAKVYYSSPEGLERLAQAGIPVDHGIHKRNTFVISDFSTSEIAQIERSGYRLEVLVEDVDQEYQERKENAITPDLSKNAGCQNNTIDYATPVNYKSGSMGGYLNYQEVLDELDAMRALYPDLITTRADVGSFTTNGTAPAGYDLDIPIGGNSIQWVRISNNADVDEAESEILYTALHHAREPNSMQQLIFFMWYLLENYESDPQVKYLLDQTELYFIPVVNPDGYLYNQYTNPDGGGNWRKNRFNAYGVDNNRNYDYYINGDPGMGIWGGDGASSDTNNGTYHGPAPFSEPENQAIKFFVEQHEFVAALNNHSFGNLLLYPFGYTANTPSSEDALFQRISERMVSQNGYANILASELYSAAGDSDDFMYGTVGTHDKIYAMTPEIGSTFWPTPAEIEGINKAMVFHNLELGFMVNPYAIGVDQGTTFVDATTFEVPYELQVLGLITGGQDFTVSLVPVTSNIISTGPSNTYANRMTGEVLSDALTVTLANDIQNGEEILMDLVVSNGQLEQRSRVRRIYGAIATVFQDMGNSVTANFDNEGWGTTTSDFVSPSSSITDSPSGNYSANSTKYLTLNQTIDLTDAVAARVSFHARWEIEDGWDYVQFEASVDGGISWIPQCGNYSNGGSTNGTQPIGEPLYDGTQLDWVLEEIDLSDYLGSTVLFRFEFVSDPAVNLDGFYFDDLQVDVVESNLGLPESESLQFELFPNPATDIVTLQAPPGNYQASLYTIQGQQLMRQEFVGKTTFDLQQLASGLYFVSVMHEGRTVTFKLIKE